ncbi:MAG: hypothetical protein ACR2FQ_04895 [Pseudonocardiaceae bacterium]
MTIRQLYYTSCQHGKEGTQGFQVNAASAGVAERHEDLGLRLSAYQPSPSAPVLPTPEQIARFPVVVGYRSFADAAVLFHSRYLGTDFTGRQGNYFAHVLVLDAPDQDLDGMLPIEAWDSGLWSWQPSQETQLPLVDAIPPGPLADTERIRTHLLEGRLPEFGVLLSAVQEGLAGRADRVVVVAPNAVDVARALAAVTRSLPAALARAVSFTTFTSSPADAEVLVAGTTPDVEVISSPYGDQIVVTLAADGSGDGTTSRYASVLRDCWARGVTAVGEVVTLAVHVSPPLEAAELDQFADLVELTVPGPSGTVQAPLKAVEFALCRLPSALAPALWQRVDDQIRRVGSFDDVERWSDVFAAASRAGTAPGPELESAYVRAALSQSADGALDPASIWLPSRTSGRRDETAVEWALGALRASPQLATAASVLGVLARLEIRQPGVELQSLVVEVVLAELLNPHLPDAPTQLRRLPDVERLLPLVCAQLEDRLAPDALFDTAVEELLSPAAADLLKSVTQRGSRCALAASLAHARGTRTGRVPALLHAVQAHPSSEAVERFAALLWPGLPTADEGVELCRRLDAAVLGATNVPQRLMERLIKDAEGPGLTRADEELADLLAADPLAGSLGSAVDTADCVRWGAYFNNSPKPSEEVAQAAVDTVRYTARAAVAVADWAGGAVANWLLSLTDSTYHAQVLLRLVRESGSQSFLMVYDLRLAVILASAKPTTIAAILPAVVFLADKNDTGQRLLDTTCRNALTQRRKRELDAIGRSFESKNRKLAPLLPSTGRRAAKNWPSWWKDWREHNLPQSTLARFFRRRASGGDV